MLEKYLRFVILVFGYVSLSQLAEYSSFPSAARSTAAFLMLMIIYRFPSPMNVRFAFWVKGSFVTAAVVFFINLGILDNLSVLLLLVSYIFGTRKRLVKKKLE